jgi:CheY-like chemotaxis protein
VLVVDDDPDSRELIRTVLDTCGARVALAGSAGEALHLIDRQPFDVLIADIGMPERDGYSLIRAVRALPVERGALMPAIAVTAYAGSSDRDQAIAAGFNRHLAKPVEPDLLMATVAFVVGSPA